MQFSAKILLLETLWLMWSVRLQPSKDNLASLNEKKYRRVERKGDIVTKGGFSLCVVEINLFHNELGCFCSLECLYFAHFLADYKTIQANL